MTVWQPQHLLVLLLATPLVWVHGAVVTFTGNIQADFTADYFAITDIADLRVDCGFDVREVRFAYDSVSDTGYFGTCDVRSQPGIAVRRCLYSIIAMLEVACSAAAAGR